MEAMLSEAFALEEIYAGKPLPQRRLAGRLGVDKGKVSRPVGSLEGMGSEGARPRGLEALLAGASRGREVGTGSRDRGARGTRG